MGTHYYLLKKSPYNPWTPPSIGCVSAKWSKLEVKRCNNGYVWCDHHFATLEELNHSYYQTIYIGTLNPGFYFSLAIYPGYGIRSLSDWKKLFESEKAIIRCDSEDRDWISASEMIKIITQRDTPGFDSYHGDVKQYEADTLAAINKTIREMEELPIDMETLSVRYHTYDEFLKAKGLCRGRQGLLKYVTALPPDNENHTYQYIRRNANSQNTL